MSYRPIVLILLFLTFLSPTSNLLADEDSGKNQIEALLLRYAESLDRQDAALAEQALHADSRQFAVTPNGFMALSKQDYLGLLEQKKIGGVISNPSVQHIAIAGAAANAILERPITDHGVLFTHYVQLLNTDGAWTVVSVTTGISKMES